MVATVDREELKVFGDWGRGVRCVYVRVRAYGGRRCGLGGGKWEGFASYVFVCVCFCCCCHENNVLTPCYCNVCGVFCFSFVFFRFFRFFTACFFHFLYYYEVRRSVFFFRFLCAIYYLQAFFSKLWVTEAFYTSYLEKNMLYFRAWGGWGDKTCLL